VLPVSATSSNARKGMPERPLSYPRNFPNKVGKVSVGPVIFQEERPSLGKSRPKSASGMTGCTHPKAGSSQHAKK